jgi:GTPase SAR1 family protein
MNQPTNSKITAHLLKPIHDTCAALSQLKIDLSKLHNQLNEEGEINLAKQVAGLVKRVSQGEQALERPTITFATLGTTSSGKSTALNGIIGAKIAPMDADELSAGLLTLEHHSNDWELYEANEAGEATGSLMARGEDAVYQHLKHEMEMVIHSRRTDNIIKGKNYLVRGQLFLCDPGHPITEALGDNVRLRIIDLPGLRTAQDSHNAPIIKERIKQAFSIVLIDRTQMFEHEKIKQLLKELDVIVQDLSGNDSLMAFIFNKIDTKTQSDKPLTQHIHESETTIKSNIRLRSATQFKLIPFSGLLYQYSTRLLTTLLSEDLDKANRIRNELLSDCKSQFDDWFTATRPQDTNSREYQEWELQDDRLNDLDRARKRDKPSTREDLIWLAQLAIGLSHHEKIWDAVVTKIRENLTTVLLYPVIRPIYQELSDIITTILTHARTQQTGTKEELENELLQLEKYRRELHNSIHQEHHKLSNKLKDLPVLFKDRQTAIEKNRGLDAEDIEEKIEQHLNSLTNQNNNNIKGNISDLHKLTNNLINNLQNDFLRPFLSIFMEKEDTLFSKRKNDLRLKLSIWINSSEFLDETLDQALLFRNSGYNKDLASVGVKDYKAVANLSIANKDAKIEKNYANRGAEDQKQIEKFKELEKRKLRLYLAIRKCMSAYAEVWLHRELLRRMDDFNELNTVLSEQIWHNVRTQLTDKFKGSIAFDVTPTISSLLPTKLEQVPEDVFSLPLPQPPRRETEQAKIGSERYDAGWICSDVRTRSVEGTITYEIYNIPNIGQIETDLTLGIAAGNAFFYGKLLSWLDQNIKTLIQQLNTQLDTLVDNVELSLKKHASELSKNANIKVAYWKNIEQMALICRTQTETIYLSSKGE